MIGPVAPELGGTAVGGVANHMQELAFALISEGHSVEVTYFAQTKSYQWKGVRVWGRSMFLKPILSLIGLFIHPRVLFLNHFTWLEKIFFAEQLMNVKSILKNGNYDVLHIHSVHNVSSSFYRLLKGLPPMVLTDHGSWLRVKSDRYPEKVKNKIALHASLASKIIAISDYAQGKLEGYITREDQTKVSRISNPIEFGVVSRVEKDEARKRMNLPEDKKIILFNGLNKSVSIKGVDLLVKAMALLDDGFMLVAVADSQGQELIRTKVKQNFVLFDRVERATLSTLYRAVDLVAVPSRGESFGLIYIEAFAHEVPALGFSPLIKEFNATLGLDCGVGFDPEIESIEDLAAAISIGLSKSGSFSGLSEKVKNEYAWSKHVHSFIKVYNEAIDDSAG